MGAILLFMFVLGFINTFKECIVAIVFTDSGSVTDVTSVQL